MPAVQGQILSERLCNDFIAGIVRDEETHDVCFAALRSMVENPFWRYFFVNFVEREKQTMLEKMRSSVALGDVPTAQGCLAYIEVCENLLKEWHKFQHHLTLLVRNEEQKAHAREQSRQAGSNGPAKRIETGDQSARADGPAERVQALAKHPYRSEAGGDQELAGE